MAEINGRTTGSIAVVDTNGSIQTGLFDSAGNPALKTKGGVFISATDRFMGIAGLNDSTYRPFRVSRSGAMASAKFSPVMNYQLFTAALPPTWLAPAATMTIAHTTSAGTQLNAAATGGISTHSSLISEATLPKYQKNLSFYRSRLRILKGSTNGQADWGLSSTQAPAAAVLTNGFVFLYGSDSTLKPTVYMNGAVIAQGSDFASLISSTQYYVWSVLLDDDSVTFVCQDPTTSTIISEQTLNINAGDPRFGMSPYWFAHQRTFVTSAAANTGTQTQVWVADVTCGIEDLDMGKPWPHVQASNGMNSLQNPTIAATQLANWANSAAPVSATLSNTAAGYTTLGGQFQFAAVAGAETDYALFGFTVPTGVKLIVTGIRIDTLNTGAAVATTATWLSWFAAADAPAVTLATNTYRFPLGNQVFPIAAAIGAQAASITQSFNTPLVTHSGRFFHVGVKMPLGTATASQVIRGTVQIEGYFE